MNKLINCVNTVKCIGTISEVLIDFIPKNGNILLKGSIVLRVEDSFIKFNLFTNKKMKKNYYDIIGFFGIPYEYIKEIDLDSYTLNNVNLINCEICGKIRVFESQSKIKNEYNINDNKPSKAFMIANVNEYGNNITYIQHNKNKHGLEVKLQGVIYKNEDGIVKILNSSKDGDVSVVNLRLGCDIGSVEYGRVYDLILQWDNGYKIKDDVVYESLEPMYKLIGIKETKYLYDKATVDNIIKLYEIEEEMKNKATS